MGVCVVKGFKGCYQNYAKKFLEVYMGHPTCTAATTSQKEKKNSMRPLQVLFESHPFGGYSNITWVYILIRFFKSFCLSTGVFTYDLEGCEREPCLCGFVWGQLAEWNCVTHN